MDSADSSRYVPDYRKANFKNKNRFQADEVRRRRETQQVELRKQKREEMLSKRRNFTGNEHISGLPESDDEDAASQTNITMIRCFTHNFNKNCH